MKNIKLLLATTAILSTGAFVANAAPGDITGESASVELKAEIIKARSLSATPLNFGRIVIDETVYGVQLYIDSSGVEGFMSKGAIGGNGYILTQGSKAVITGASCSQLSPISAMYEAPLTKPNGSSVELAMVSNFACSDDSSGNATISGTLYVENRSSHDPIPAGIYTGSLTVTAIYPVATQETPTEP